jgi:hypothetical protein
MMVLFRPGFRSDTYKTMFAAIVTTSVLIVLYGFLWHDQPAARKTSKELARHKSG